MDQIIDTLITCGSFILGTCISVIAIIVVLYFLGGRNRHDWYNISANMDNYYRN